MQPDQIDQKPGNLDQKPDNLDQKPDNLFDTLNSPSSSVYIEYKFNDTELKNTFQEKYINLSREEKGKLSRLSYMIDNSIKQDGIGAITTGFFYDKIIFDSIKEASPQVKSLVALQLLDCLASAKEENTLFSITQYGKLLTKLDATLPSEADNKKQELVTMAIEEQLKNLGSNAICIGTEAEAMKKLLDATHTKLTGEQYDRLEKVFNKFLGNCSIGDIIGIKDLATLLDIHKLSEEQYNRFQVNINGNLKSISNRPAHEHRYAMNALTYLEETMKLFGVNFSEEQKKLAQSIRDKVVD